MVGFLVQLTDSKDLNSIQRQLSPPPELLVVHDAVRLGYLVQEHSQWRYNSNFKRHLTASGAARIKKKGGLQRAAKPPCFFQDQPVFAMLIAVGTACCFGLVCFLTKDRFAGE